MKPYNKDNLPEDAFGGEYQGNDSFVIRQGDRELKINSKINNAYVLIYEREEFIDTNELFKNLEGCKTQEEAQHLYEQCKVQSTFHDFNENTDSCVEQIRNELNLANKQFWMQGLLFSQTFMKNFTNCFLSLKIAENQDYKGAFKQSLQKVNWQYKNNQEKQNQTLKFVIQIFFSSVLRYSLRQSVICSNLPFIKEGI